MRAGDLRHRITIQSQGSPANPFATGDSWNTVIIMWAKIEPLTSKEVFQAGQVAMKVTHTITIRHPGKNVSVSAGDRILFLNRVFQLQAGIMNELEQGYLLKLMAYEIDPTR